ncbi:hypothetical protein HPB47_002018 [Ixodes persulcatus]|uniref:Uncharacterized protein n=1 Tax=Ixodes persulcatus TaxID=34615 RepID=A0AC60PNN2_IXOPE|nr:hypothetical protein HPB47_002018 [Ixodes persulcatus]
MLPRLRAICVVLRGPLRSLSTSSYLVGPKEPPQVRMTVGQALDETVRNHGDRVGFHFPGEDLSLTFSGFAEQVERLALGLGSLDLEPGCRIGLLSPTCHRWIVSQFAVAKAGLVLVSINDKCHPKELGSVLKRGSTGPPKLIPLSHFNVLNAIQMLKAMTGFSSGRTLMCTVLPLFHTFGHIDVSTFGVVAGVPTVYLPPGAPHAQTLEAIQRYRCTAIQGTPTTYYDLIQCREFNKYDISSLCEGVIGATSVQTSALEMIAEKLKINNLVTAYGLTETAGPVAFGYRDKTGYHPAPHTEIRIVDAAGSVLPVGEVGEVQVRGPSVFAGYWKHSVTGVYDDGWLPTGRTFEIKGRIKDLVIKGGVNISPEEVETALLGHDAILEASVVGVPDARLGEEVNSLKVPKYVVIVDEFPRTSVGKVSKPDIRKVMAEKLNGTRKAMSEAA